MFLFSSSLASHSCTFRTIMGKPEPRATQLVNGKLKIKLAIPDCRLVFLQYKSATHEKLHYNSDAGLIKK